MSAQRKQVIEPVVYRGHKITATFAGPDLLAQVDGDELPHFYVNSQAAIKAGERYIDAKLKVEEEAKAKKR